MSYLIAGMVLMAVVVIMARRRRFYATLALRQAFYKAQVQAAEQLTIQAEALQERVRFELDNGFECICWMSQADDGLTHHVLGKMPGVVQKKLIQQMLQVMAELSHVFKTVGIQDKIKFNIAASEQEPDAHVLSYTLSAEQHRDYMDFMNTEASR